MEIVIENVPVEHIDVVVSFIERWLSQPLSITSIRVESRWVNIGGGAVIRHEELRPVIIFDPTDFPLDDTVMRALTDSFGGTGFIFSVPAMPGMRWETP